MPVTRKPLLACMAALLALGSASVAAKDDAAKHIIADLQRIVAPDGVQESFKATLGGFEQWVSVRGSDRDNPLLLFVHGGPASPMMPQGWAFQRPWEDWFTVVQWDQRGAGRTYLENAPQTVAPTLDIERYVDDTVALIALLRERYGKRKVILVGHSWGTVVGLKAALKRPEWIHAYVGISQVIDFQENERLGYEFALAAAQRDGNDAAIDELRALAPYPGDGALTIERIARQRRWVQHYGGLAAYRDNAGYYAAVPQLSPEYDAAALDAIGKGSALTLSRVLDELAGVDFTRVTEVSFPVVVFMGRHDYMVPSQPAAAWLDALKAPAKRGVWFEHSAHLAMFEEPGRVLVALVNDVLPLAREERAR